jgi:phosphoenolpyruvate-protein phosphotransferase
MVILSENLPATDPAPVLPISPGIAIGPVRLFRQVPLSIDATTIAPDQVEAEQHRLQEAIDKALEELRQLAVEVEQTVGRSEADIFEAHQLILQDPELLDEVVELINQHHSAAAALHQAAEHSAQELEALENETLAARAADIRDVANRAIRHLQNQNVNTNKDRDGDSRPVLLVANDLTPSDTANLSPKSILGICTVVGGPTTHAAIIARALEIPAIAGIDPRLLDVLHEGQHIAIDGTQGLLYLHPDAEQQQLLRISMDQQQQARDLRRTQNAEQWCARPGSTADGYPVQIFANIGDLESARAAAEAGAEGIGLLRTEFLFGGRSVFPGEEEQFDAYVTLFRAFADHASFGKTIIARTLDAGADKPFPALEPLIGPLQEANPALGLRGARIHLLHEELLRQQLRALLRANAEASIDLHIMFPMVATLEEVRRLRTVYATIRQELQQEGLALQPGTQLGIMVETPAAAVMADALAREVDFFSIGANDLSQYTMAADRTNSRVTSMFGILEPAVWRLIDQVVRAARTHNKTVALCGELAADTRIGPLLAGLGVQELSMSPPAVVNVKAALNQHTFEYWQQKAQELLKAETAEEMRVVLEAVG